MTDCMIVRLLSTPHPPFESLTLKLVLTTPSGFDFSFLFLLFLRDSGFTMLLRVSGTGGCQ